MKYLSFTVLALVGTLFVASSALAKGGRAGIVVGLSKGGGRGKVSLNPQPLPPGEALSK